MPLQYIHQCELICIVQDNVHLWIMLCWKKKKIMVATRLKEYIRHTHILRLYQNLLLLDIVINPSTKLMLTILALFKKKTIIPHELLG